MGVGTGPTGKILVTDMDCIERSNLCRQFLFRSSDIGKSKSSTAADAIRKINPDIKVISLTLEVGPASENVLDSDFFEQLDVVVNALDNLNARYYMDEKCVEYHIPLLESGTHGGNGNTQIIVPGLTRCYRDVKVVPPEIHAKCTLTYFPYKIEHTIQWARDKFEELFTLSPTVALNYLKNGRYGQKLKAYYYLLVCY